MCCGLLGIVPATASAGNTTVSLLGSLLYNAVPGETNIVTISLESPSCTTAGTADPCYVLTETGPGVMLTASVPCVLVNPTTATCPAGVGSIDVDLADADDQLTVTAPTPANVSAGTGNDTVSGGSAGDILRGQAGRDTVAGNGGNDTVYGYDVLGIVQPDDPNVISGGDGDDRLEAGNGGDSARGDSGRDTMLGARGNDLLEGGEDADEISGDAGNDTLLGQTGNDTVGRADQQGAGAFTREGGDDLFDGGSGDDTLQAGIGPFGGVSDRDTFAGGDGTDSITYQQRTASVRISLDGRRDDGGSGEQDDVQASIENATAGTGADTLVGTAAANRLDGGGGADAVNGGDGPDALLGSSGDDDVRGAAGGDDVQGGTGEDFVDGGAGNDNLTGGGASDAIQSRDTGQDTVDCGERVDFAIADRTDKVTCDRVDRNPRDRPRLGTRAALDPRSGDLQLNLPEAQRFVPLELHVNAPVGSSVDATGGRVRVTTAVSSARVAASRSRRQSAVFYRGAFRVRQQRSRGGLTDISLRGGEFSVCGSGQVSISAKKKKRVRSLWGKGKGKFRTNGRYSSAAVRGTKWLTEDRCDGTLTRVTQGRVSVFDRARKRTVQLKAGQRYLARAP